MRIGIYCNDLNPESGGASTLTRTIIKEIKEVMAARTDYTFVLLTRGGKKAARKIEIDGVEAVNIDRFSYLKNKILTKLNYALDTDLGSKEFDEVAEAEQLDIIWFCNLLCAQISIPYIVTVWDLGHRTVPYFPEVSLGHTWRYREHLYSRMIPNASWVLTGNEEGKKEILTNYSISEDKIRIAPFPVSSFCYETEEKPDFELPETYFFYPAQFWAHKNHAVILHALKHLKETAGSTPTVFFTGSDKGNKEYIASLAEELGVSDQIKMTGFLSDAQLKYMYTHATAMIFASLMGPNNLPPIEAAFLGCPVIITDLKGHQEQLGDAALYFNGTSEEELTDRMIKVMDETVRKDLIQKEAALRKELAEIKYIEPVLKIIQEFEWIRRCWKQ